MVVLFNLIIIVKMRYQSKTNRSLSYLLRDSVEYRHQHNKENANVINFPTLKENLPKGLPLHNIQEEVKLEKRVRSTTVVSVSSLLRKATLPQELKKSYTRLVMNDYSNDLSDYFCEAASTHQCDNMLLRHQITSSLRSKMVDWMIQVLSSYKMSEETFFKSVYLMDAYLKRSRATLEVKDLHLIGLSAMFLASKYEEIHPLKLEVIYDKIARKKFKKSEILQCQAKMMETLMFSLENPSVYDIARLAAEKINGSMSEKSSRYFDKIVLYLSKMVLFNSQLAGLAFDVLGGGVVFIGLKTLEQADPQVLSELFLPEICARLSLQEEQLIEISRRVLELAKNFSSYFPSLTNLKKFNRFQYQ